MSRQQRACDISASVKKKVWERDKRRCVYCGSPYAMPNAHFIRRSHGGLGIEENVVTLCQDCHRDFDSYKNPEIERYLELYLKEHYENWNKQKLIYKGDRI